MCKNDERLDAAPMTRGRADPGQVGGETRGRASKTTGFDLGPYFLGTKIHKSF
jgi:hypothetical protein